jgi:hypothetical protein
MNEEDKLALKLVSCGWHDEPIKLAVKRFIESAKDLEAT